MEDENRVIKDAIVNAHPARFPDFTELHEQLRTAARANIHHTPRQEGPYLVCTSCHHKHTLKYIGTNKLLTGFTQEGEPILKNR